MLMNCVTGEWRSLRRANRLRQPRGKARCLQLLCHSQGDTVLVGGPPGEKGNKGETVSAHLDVPPVLFLDCLPCSVVLLIKGFTVVPFQGDRGPKGVQGEKGVKGQEGPAGEQVISFLFIGLEAAAD